jgi:hypothetical protein
MYNNKLELYGFQACFSKYICYSRVLNIGMNLKPQDVVVALKLFGYPVGRPAMSIVASDLGLSPSEVHGAIQRQRTSRLLHGPALKDKPNITGLKNFWFID